MSTPPTHFALNDFTRVFQEVIDTYGVPRYREVSAFSRNVPFSLEISSFNRRSIRLSLLWSRSPLCSVGGMAMQVFVRNVT